MEKEIFAEILKEKIIEVENSKKDKDPSKIVLSVNLSSEAFLRLAYLFVGMYGK